MTTYCAVLTFSTYEEFLRWQAAEAEMRKQNAPFSGVQGRTYFYENYDELRHTVQRIGQVLKKDHDSRREEHHKTQTEHAQ